MLRVVCDLLAVFHSDSSIHHAESLRAGCVGAIRDLLFKSE